MQEVPNPIHYIFIFEGLFLSVILHNGGYNKTLKVHT